MKNGLPKLMAALTLMILMFSSLVAAPVHAQVEPAASYGQFTPEPLWATINAAAQGNYPGGVEVFTVFVVNSALPPEGNVTIENETLTAPFQTNFAPGLPVSMAPGNSILSTIALGIPSDFSQNNFTAKLAVNTLLFNGTKNIALTLTGTVQVFVLALPGQSTGKTTTTTETVTQGGGVSTTVFAAGVVIPSLIAVIFLVMLVQARGRPKPAGT